MEVFYVEETAAYSEAFGERSGPFVKGWMKRRWQQRLRPWRRHRQRQRPRCSRPLLRHRERRWDGWAEREAVEVEYAAMTRIIAEASARHPMAED
jgi:hypothetical protein